MYNKFNCKINGSFYRILYSLFQDVVLRLHNITLSIKFNCVNVVYRIQYLTHNLIIIWLNLELFVELTSEICDL